MFEVLFSERGLSLERLRVLIEVQDAGSIANTAPGDETRHSQYSRQLRELSEFFGCELTQRSGKELKLTRDGTQLAELIRPLLKGLLDFHSQCRGQETIFRIGAGDSLIHWLVIPRIGQISKELDQIRFETDNLRTNEIVEQLADGRVEFGLIRKNGVAAGLKSTSLGSLEYVAVVPVGLAGKTRRLTLERFFCELPMAMQVTDGQFSEHLRRLALAQNPSFAPALGCQSFPQTIAAVRSGQFAAIVPTLALDDLKDEKIQKISGGLLRSLQRDIVLAWNPRVIKIRVHAEKVLSKMQMHFRFR